MSTRMSMTRLMTVPTTAIRMSILTLMNIFIPTSTIIPMSMPIHMIMLIYMSMPIPMVTTATNTAAPKRTKRCSR